MCAVGTRAAAAVWMGEVSRFEGEEEVLCNLSFLNFLSDLDCELYIVLRLVFFAQASFFEIDNGGHCSHT